MIVPWGPQCSSASKTSNDVYEGARRTYPLGLWRAVTCKETRLKCRNTSRMNGVAFSWFDLLEILSAFAASGSLAGLVAWLIQRVFVVKNTEHFADDQRMEVTVVDRGRRRRMARPDGDRSQVSSDRTLSLIHAIREYRKLMEPKPLTLQRPDYAYVVQELNKAIDRAESGFRADAGDL